MFTRGAATKALRYCNCAKTARSSTIRTTSRRHVSSTASSVPVPSSVAAKAHPWAGVTTQIDQVAPRFEIDASQIEIVDSPTAFYTTLKDKIKKAQKRIYLSTLYIGKTENELIDTIRDALQANPNLQVAILTDYLRGTREDPNPSCASLLVPLVAEFGDRVKVRMYHTPNLNGWKKEYMPKRINEGWGLQHMKLYGFDDEIMLSGANLSDDYFTNRLDRYHIFRSKELADFYHDIHDGVSEISYNLVPSDEHTAGFELQSPMHRGIPDPVFHPQRFKRHAKQLLEPLIRVRARQKIVPLEFDEDKTFVYPLAQFDILLGQPTAKSFMNYEFRNPTSTEKPVLTKLLAALAKDDALRKARWTFTAGYFNIDPDICAGLLEATPASKQLIQKGDHLEKPCTVITASPWANGFYGSSGISGMLPAAYTLLSRRFLRQVAKAGKEDAVQLKEWRKGTVGQPGGFTYHAKGIWITLPSQVNTQSEEEAGPSVTLVGSSNYTKRSYSLDLEVGALVVTADEELKRKLKAEVEWLEKDATVTTQDDLMKVERRVGARVRAALWLVERLGGAL
ncbi:CDP-diacylglycerol--glycerol-3-phosphate 3-phosphatidyltransferase [Lithohypha guttulata]|uniref:CDP-diacylglycerol--glycerol-3-phosphate 3-phosphatidyltransferase n=1 Tax=Lithohypha guttulata TaxID=1690604 RepID=A0AAN7YEA9_9EURO|nr:CDP-diacylglycerol--glycerol-3-phosphate 3-phosphatidyltransferase [Lithohypha guttulata]